MTEHEFEPEENLQGVEIESSYLRRLLQVLRLPTTDLKRNKKPTEEQDFEARFVGCIGKFKKCLFNEYDQAEGENGFKSILQKSIHFQ